MYLTRKALSDMLISTELIQWGTVLVLRALCMTDWQQHNASDDIKGFFYVQAFFVNRSRNRQHIYQK